ncbi:MAG: ParA family protein [Treponema sp.]|nr:ParA family protein [Treponema sp.]
MITATKIAFINSKGGCGKTTSIFHVSGVLSKLNKKVLVIDLDKQRNTTSTLMMNVDKEYFPKKTVFDFLQGKATADEATGKALFQRRGNARPKYYGVDCMVADSRLENEVLLKKIDGKNINTELDEFIKKQSYDWILVDMPPSSAALSHICFAYMVNFVIVPFSSDIFSLDGYDNIAETIKDARNINENLSNLGVYLARYMGNCALDKYIKSELSERLANRALNTNGFIDIQIPLASDIREAVFYGRPISYYKEFSNSCRAYERLVHEITKRIKFSR